VVGWWYIQDLRYSNHNELVNRILILLHSNKLGRFWANNTGAVKTVKGHFQRYGLKGSSDIIGLSKTGQFVGIEVKTGAGRQSGDQKNFQRMIESNGGMYFMVREESDMQIIIDSLI
jgi:hypothetical protein